MRFIVTFVFVAYFCIVLAGKNNVKSLSESMGQEVIEIEGPKEMPSGFEEEPGAVEEGQVIPTTLATTKKEKKSTTVTGGRKNLNIGRELTTALDDEARLEKELAEIYKDTDYKEITDEPETSATTNTTSTEDTAYTEKPVGRVQGSGFKFAPDSTDKRDIERFRTSKDDVSCASKSKLNVDEPTNVTPVGPMSGSTTKLCPVLALTQVFLALGTLICL